MKHHILGHEGAVSQFHNFIIHEGFVLLTPSLIAINLTSRNGDLPSGKRLHNYGKSPFFMGKSTINGHFQ